MRARDGRIGVTQWSLDGQGPETVRRAAALGFGTIHLSSGELDGDLRLDDLGLRDRYLDAARDAGVAIGAIAAGDLNDLGLTSPAGSTNAGRCRESIGIAIDAAIDMKVPLVFLPSFRAGEIRTATDLDRTAAFLAEACDLAAGHSVVIATENTLGAEGNLRLLTAASRPGLRILLDTQNPALWGHTVAAMVEALWPYLADQVHVKDGRGGEMGNAVLGEGDSGFADTRRALQEGGFVGALISENDYHGGRSLNAQRDIAIMTQALGS